MSDIMQEISEELSFAEAEALLQETLDKIVPPDKGPAMRPPGARTRLRN